ncbi:Vsp/OspC family lipoprotein [Borrelia turicatae]|uniref:Vsp6 n=1 Tax=Borrelia turicatae (strain 91E135) TaxID=314724 RepID=A0ABF7R0D8_BORT9|nr:Vsp/OspC family lipoprotein [Borrelia turicatae]ASJ27795.1 Vsp6 [Borrelia turicatae 91E135]UPA14263.1 hypothetical protein bt91E135_001442 [Borrelia turicatae 91E135]
MKRITLSALLMTLFLFMSCNNSGTSPKDGQAAKSDGTVIDLATITKNITDSVAFATSVKEVHTLVMSIDELAKAIGKKIKNDGSLEAESTNADKNSQLVAGAFSVILEMSKLVKALKEKTGYGSVKKQVDDIETKILALVEKIKKDGDLCKDGVSENHAKESIDKTNKPDGTKGAKELGELNIAIDELLKAAEAAVESAIKELITPAKSGSAQPSNT